MANRKTSNSKATCKALIVAIDDYPGSGNDLPSCLNDAKAMTELLKAAPYEFQDVRTYENADATIQNVTHGLNWLLNGNLENEGQNNPEDRLVFYYSGHGFRTEQDGILRECLCLYDGFFFDKELSVKTQNLPPSVLTVILDSCHSGGMEKRFFNLLSAQDEVPAERVRIKTWIPNPEEFAKAIAAEENALPIKEFGSSFKSPNSYISEATTKAFDEVPLALAAETQVNGLLITACQEDQTASASSLQTEGKSAFTFCLLNAFKKLGSQLSNSNQLSSSKLFDTVAQELEALRFKQIPKLIEPPNSPGLKLRSFITFQPIDQTSEATSLATSPGIDASTSAPNQSALSPDTTPPPSTTTQGDKPMQATSLPLPTNAQASAVQSQPTLPPEVINQIIQTIQQQLQPTSGKDFQPSIPTTQMPEEVDEKYWGIVLGGISAAASIYQALRDKDFQPGMPATQVPVIDEKFLRVLPQLLPGIMLALQGRDKDFQPSTVDTLNHQVFEAGEKFPWAIAAQVAGAVIAAAPGVYNALRSKDIQPGVVGIPNSQTPAAQPFPMSPDIINSIMQSLQQSQVLPQGSQTQTTHDKDFQFGVPNRYTNGAPIYDEKTWSSVIVPLVTGVIGAVPGIIQAVRGKDYQPGDPEDEQVLKAILPALIPTIFQQIASGQYRPADVRPQILPYPIPNPALAR